MEWITDRRPTLNDCNGSNSFVYNSQGVIAYYATVELGEAWMPIPNVEPYVKPKRFRVTTESGMLVVYDNKNGHEVAGFLPNHGAGARLAAIYEELMP